jgi:hypothetical protein
MSPWLSSALDSLKQMDILPHTRHGWVRLVALPFEVYVLSGFWLSCVYFDYTRRDYAGDWIVWIIVGYVCCFWILVTLGIVQSLTGARKDAQVTWMIAATTPVFLLLMLPWLAS